MPRLFRTTLLAAAVLATILPASAGAIDLNAPLPVGPQVKVGKLANGLTYYIQQNGKPEHKLELRLVVKAGSVLEDDDQQGLAHMVEHLAFNGSTHFKKQELVSYLQSIGLKFGADLNAYTGPDQTFYMLPVPTDRKENVDMAFTVLEDWAHGVTFNPEDVDKERAIIYEDARTHKGVQERIQRALAPKLYLGSRYPEREPIGREEVIRTATPDLLRRFYRDWYRPDLMAVIVVGDIDPQEAERQIQAHFAGLKNPAPERPRVYQDIAARTASEAFVFTDAEIPVNTVALHYPARFHPDPATYGSYREHITDMLFTAMVNQRLAGLAQGANPPFLFGGVQEVPLSPRHREFVQVAGVGAGGSAPAIAALQQEQQRIRQYGFTAAELEPARKFVLNMFERGYNERNTTDSARYVEEYQRNFLTNEEIAGREAEFRLASELLPAIGVDDVNAAARTAFPPDAAKLVVYAGGTKSGAAPTEQQLLADIAAGERASVENRTEKALATRLMARPARPGRIVAESRDAKLGLTRLTLSNGVQVILKPSDFRKDQVLLGAKRYGGQTLFNAQDLQGARLAAPLAMVMGLKDYSALDLGKMLAGRNAAANVSLGMYTDEISGQSGSGPEDLETMFQMLWLRFDGVHRDENAYNAAKGRVGEVLRNRAAQPEARFADTIVDTVYAGHAYEPREPKPDEIAGLELGRSITLYRQRFASARGLTFVLAGDFQVEAIKPLVAAYLGTLPTPALPLAYRDVGLRPAKGVVRKEVVGGIEPKSVLSLTFAGPAAWSPTEGLRMGALTEVMNLRVVSVLREKLGLLYGGGMAGSVQRIPYQHYEISTQLTTAPDKVDALTAAIFAEIDNLKASGPTPAELDKVKANWRQNFRQWQHENGYWITGLQDSLLDGTDPARILSVSDEIEQLTTADVQKAAQRYFDKNNYVEVVLKPEAPQKTASAAAP
jgi:zinc protease